MKVTCKRCTNHTVIVITIQLQTLQISRINPSCCSNSISKINIQKDFLPTETAIIHQFVRSFLENSYLLQYCDCYLQLLSFVCMCQSPVMPNARPHRLQLARLLYHGFPCKNTGLGCHSLIDVYFLSLSLLFFQHLLTL